MQSPLKLKAVHPCLQVDRLINAYVFRNKDSTNSPKFLHSLHDTPPKKHTRARSTTFKTSLADWRSLYQRPPTDASSLFGIVTPKRNERFSFHRKNQSTTDMTYKRSQQNSPLYTNTKFWVNSPRKKDEGARTAINFYRSPMSGELDALGSLVSRIEGPKTQRKGFREKKMRKTSHFSLTSGLE